MPAESLLKALALAGLMLLFTATDKAQTGGPRAVITQALDEGRLVTLVGNTRPEANRKNDLGPVSDGLHLDMYLQLKRSPEQDLAAQQFVESLTDPASPNFHKWITAAEYGQRFGAASEDIATVSRWLESHGFAVNGVPANNMVIDFSGTAGQVREALHTEIHVLAVAGERHFANMSDPQIPAALLPAVTGVVSLHNFRPRPMLVPRPQYTASPTQTLVAPGDLATIYNLNPAFSGGYTGQGQTIVVVEDTDLYNGTGDWSVFRTIFGLTPQYPYGSLTQVHPAPGAGSACDDPGINGDDDEAAIDVEWASAAAPNAAILMASCGDTTNFGGFIALQNMLTNGGPLPSVVSISYGESENVVGAAFNSFINTLYQTAAAAGVSVFVSSGDDAAAGNDRYENVAIHGVNVSAFASTAYNVAVGGTDFGDTAMGATSTFWNSTNGVYYNSAKSYVPEIPWNDSCASVVFASSQGFSSTYGPAGSCNSLYNYLETDGGSGGPSGCATGASALQGVVDGTCAGYAKPAWQSVFGNPNDGVRDLPDVSLFAAPGFWGHYYVFCLGCTSDPSTWYGAGGTSFASPIMAGIQTVINQALGSTNVGNPNPVYYQIAQGEYSTSAGRTGCNSTSGPASTCSFNDVTQGDMVVPCAGIYNCYFGGGGLGVLSTSDTSYAPAYAAAPGWDFATGIGTVNVLNLLNAFVDSVAPSRAPAAPVLVSPANGATAVLPGATLSWNASAGATSYDVYLGTAAPPPLVTNTVDIDYAPGTLSAGTKYYWAVGARNSLGANVSAAWSFSTNCVSVLNPSSATVPAAGGAFTTPVTATAGCGWTAVSNAAWITITSGASGSGSGTVGYTAAADTGTQRTGTITIAGQTFTVTQAVTPLISTLAGGAMPPTAAPGTSVSIPVSYGVAVDPSGNTYFSSPSLNAVFKANAAGLVTRVAGTGLPGYSGDSGPALSAQLNNPQGVAVDASGNLYIADSSNYRIRKVSASGTITTVAGNGTYGYSGDGGPATIAEIGYPYGLAVDSSGNLYISDISNEVVRKVATSGTITTVAGNGTYGYAGDGGPATSAELYGPYGVAVGPSGNLYIADSYNYRIRMVSAGGVVTTVAGNGDYGFGGDGGPATSALLSEPSGVAVDAAGNLYLADTYNQRIRKVSAAGIITTVAGNGSTGYLGDGGAATSAQLNNPLGVAVDAGGNLHISDSGNVRIRSASAAGTISTLVGGAIGDGGLGVFGSLNRPYGVARDNAGNTYVADTDNNRVRKVAANGIITTVAGTGEPGFSGDGGAAASAQLDYPAGVAVDASGNLYIADSSNYRIRKVSASGTITTEAGNGYCCGHTGDGGPATSAEIGFPYGLAVDSSGNLYISDIYNDVVRKVPTSGTVTTVAGNGTYGYAGDGGPATSAEFNSPYGVAVDASGNLYIADSYNYRIRMVSAGGIVTTVAGNGDYGFGGDGGPATSASLAEPSGVAVDSAGNLYIADTYSNRIRQVNSTGTIMTVAGDGGGGLSGDGGPATGATLQSPWGILVDTTGNVAVGDQGNNAVRLLTPAGTTAVLSIRSEHTGNFTQGQTGVTYSVTVTNGSGAGTTNGTATVTEILPTGLTLASMAGTGWTCTPAPACTRSDALMGGSSYPAITVTVNVSAAAPVQVTNQASVSGGGAAALGRATDLTVVAAAQAAALVSIAVTPANPSITKGLTQQFTATGTYADSSTQNLTTQVTWASATTATATISTGGLATGAGVGASTISATLGAIQGSTVLTVTAATLQSIAVTPANPSIAKGLTQQFTATGAYSDGSTQNLTSQVTWASATATTATISTGGLAAGAGVGTSNISATLGAIQGSTVLTVTAATLQSIALTPANPSIVVGSSQQFQAAGTYTDGSTQNLTGQATWASTATAVSTITGAGKAAGVKVGASVISAMLASASGSTTLTVTPLGPCDVTQQGLYTVVDAQAIINEALGLAPALNDFNGDKVVNVVDIQIVINAILNLGCTV
jgi:sugar lactone lactonase YvrE